MVLEPNIAELSRVVEAWRSGNFTAARSFADLTEQDLLMDVFEVRARTYTAAPSTARVWV